jgi:hypothetical protein
MRRVCAPVEDGALAAEMIKRHFSAAFVGAMGLSTIVDGMDMAGRRLASLIGSSAAPRHFADSPAGIDIAAMDSGDHGVETGGANDLVPIDMKPASDGNAHKWRT